MAQQWLSVVEAAAALGVSPAVLRYRIHTGQVVSRFGEFGRQVLIGEPDDGDGVADMPPRRGRRALVAACAAVATLAVALGVRAALGLGAGDDTPDRGNVATRDEPR